MKWILYSAAVCGLVAAYGPFGTEARGRRMSKRYKDVCIVGGGPSGVYAARLLEAKGKDVALFEREDVLGGQTVAFEDKDGSHIERHFLLSHFDIASELAAQYGTSGPPFPDPSTRYFFSGPQPPPGLPPDTLIPRANLPNPGPEVFAAVAKYQALITDEVLALLKKPGHEHIPEEFTVPWREFLATNGLSALEPYLYPTTTNFGYGFAGDVPAVYFLKLYQREGLVKFIALQGLNFHPYDDLLQKMGEELSDVRLGTEVKRIRLLPWGQQIIRTKAGAGWNKFTLCDKTILATAPTPKALELVRGRGAKDLDLFAEVITIAYHEFILELPEAVPTPGMPPLFFVSKMFDPLPQSIAPNLYVRPKPDGRIMVLYNGGPGEVISEEQAFAFVAAHMKTVFKVDLTDDVVVGYKHHDYFPHVSKQAMHDGFYADMADLQGQRGLYFVSGLNDMELVNACFRAATDLVEKFFS